jgi:hypothetical protein
MIEETESNITPTDSPTISEPVAVPDVPFAPVSDNIDAIDYGRAIKDYEPLSTPPDTVPHTEK